MTMMAFKINYEGSKKWKKVQPFMKKTLRCWQRNPSSFEDIFQLITQSFSILQKDKSHYYIKKKKNCIKTGLSDQK